MKTPAALVIAIAVFQSAILAQEPGGIQGMNQPKHHEIMPIHAKIMEMQKAQDAEIDRLFAEVNAATGEKLAAATKRQQEIVNALDITKNQASAAVDEGTEQVATVMDQTISQNERCGKRVVALSGNSP